MSETAFQILANDLCTMFGTPMVHEKKPPDPSGSAPASPFYRLNFEVATVDFDLLYTPDVDPHLIFMLCHFGPLPTRRPAPAMRRLMELNLCIPAGVRKRFCMMPGRPDVILAYEGLLADMTPDLIVASMTNSAAHANEWRRTHFIDFPVPPSI